MSGSINDFDNEAPAAPSRPGDPPTDWKPVTASGGEVSDLGLLPGRFDRFATKTEQTLAALAEGMKLLNESVLPLIAKLERRQDDDHRAILAVAGRVDRHDAEISAIKAELAEMRRPAPTKAQRPKKRAGRKNVR